MGKNAVQLNTRVWEALMKRCVEMVDLHVIVGIQGPEATTSHDGAELTTVEIAAVHEFSGPSDSPPGRPFIRPIYDDDPEKWKGKIREACVHVIEGANPKAELRKVGEEYRREIIERVKRHIDPPLAESTLAHRNPGGAAHREKLAEKGSLDDTPLIDTGTMIGAVSVVVKKG